MRTHRKVNDALAFSLLLVAALLAGIAVAGDSTADAGCLDVEVREMKTADGSREEERRIVIRRQVESTHPR